MALSGVVCGLCLQRRAYAAALKNSIPGRVAYINARLLDPATGVNAPGGVLTEGEKIIGVGANLFSDGAPDDAELID